MRTLCGCVVACSVLLSSFLGSAAWSQSGTSEPPGLDEIIAAANSYVQASPSWTPAEAPEGAGPESDEGGNSDVLDPEASILPDAAQSEAVPFALDDSIYSGSISTTILDIFAGVCAKYPSKDYVAFRLKNAHVLLAEDNDINARITMAILEKAGVRTDRVLNGRQAVEIFKDSEEGFYDVILMDIQMPEMDGWEATRQIRELDRKDARLIPVYALSANSYVEDQRRSLAAGMDDHIAKPIDFNVLKKKMGAAIRNARNAWNAVRTNDMGLYDFSGNFIKTFHCRFLLIHSAMPDCFTDLLPAFAPIRNRWTYQLCINLPQFRDGRLEFICQHILL